MILTHPWSLPSPGFWPTASLFPSQESQFNIDFFKQFDMGESEVCPTPDAASWVSQRKDWRTPKVVYLVRV